MMVVKATGVNHLYIVFDDFNLLAYESQFLVNEVEVDVISFPWGSVEIDLAVMVEADWFIENCAS